MEEKAESREERGREEKGRRKRVRYELPQGGKAAGKKESAN